MGQGRRHVLHSVEDGHLQLEARRWRHGAVHVDADHVTTKHHMREGCDHARKPREKSGSRGAIFRHNHVLLVLLIWIVDTTYCTHSLAHIYLELTFWCSCILVVLLLV